MLGGGLSRSRCGRWVNGAREAKQQRQASGFRGAGDSTRKRVYSPRRSNMAIDSTCAVCGNMSITPAARSLQPRSLTR